MQPLPHGYTNRTVGDGTVVCKTYAGPDAPQRREREHAILTRLQGRLPVPPIRSIDSQTLGLGFVAGTHGQDLIETDDAAAVLRACGSTLHQIHAVDEFVDATAVTRQVLVHGDYGPNNLLLDPVTYQVTAVLDWEFAHLGDPIEDLAWCEWTIRMHHPRRVGLLGDFYAAYGGPIPSWPDRNAAMLAKCHWLEAFCERWMPGATAVQQWRERAAITAGWEE